MMFAKTFFMAVCFVVTLLGTGLHSVAEEPTDASTNELNFSPPSLSDRGDILAATFRIDSENSANKGIAVRLNNDGESERPAFMLFDSDTLRSASGWLGDSNLAGRSSEAYAGRVTGLAEIVGQPLFQISDIPGWSHADETEIEDSRIEGRDGNRYGPLSRESGQWLGYYRSGDQIVWSYKAYGVDILELPEFGNIDGRATLSRYFDIGPRPHDLLLYVASDATQSMVVHGEGKGSISDQVVTFRPPNPRVLELQEQGDRSSGEESEDDEEDEDDHDDDDDDQGEEDDEELLDEEDEFDDLVFDEAEFAESGTLEFEGDMSLRIAEQNAFRTTASDYTIVARIRTREGGTIFANTPRNAEYAPNSMCLFVHGDALKLDVGWVGEVSSDHEVADGQWHVVAATYRHETGKVRLFVDGKVSNSAELRPTDERYDRLVPRIGFAAKDFPDEVKGFEGPISQLAFYQRTLDDNEIASFSLEEPTKSGLVAYWNRFDHDKDVFIDASGNGHHAIFEEIGIEEDEYEQDGERQQIVFDGQSTRIEIAGIGLGRAARFSYTIGVRVKTEKGGPIFSVASKSGKWKQNDISWFVRRGRLVFDMGFVGQVEGWRRIDDGQWHDIALTYNHDSGEVGFIVDGEPDRIAEILTTSEENSLLPIETEDDLRQSVGWIGYASEDFPVEAPKFFSGQISRLRVYEGVRDPKDIANVMGMAPAESLGVLAAWTPSFAEDGFVEDHTENALHGVVSFSRQEIENLEPEFALTGCRVIGAQSGAKWVVSGGGDLRLRIPAGDEPIAFSVIYSPLDDATASTTLFSQEDVRPIEAGALASICRSGAENPDTNLTSESEVIGASDAAFVVERLNNFAAEQRELPQLFTGIDFFSEQNKAVVCTLNGEVWSIGRLASGLGNRYQWNRIATGLHQPQGLRIVDGQIYVLGNDQITRLHDYNGDGVTDYYENFNNDAQWGPSLSGSLAGFDVDAGGNFYYARGGPPGHDAVVPHHGALLRVSADGRSTDVFASGFGSPTGVAVDGKGSFWVGGMKYLWTPANWIGRVREGQLYGRRDSLEDPEDAYGELPTMWIHSELNPKPTGLFEVSSEKWGQLRNKLLVLSPESAEIQVFDLQRSGTFSSASLFSLPTEPLPTPVSSGRFHPLDGQLYVCGFRNSDESSEAEGGLYRISYSGKRPAFPIRISAATTGISIEFSDSLDPTSATDWRNYSVSRWNYRTTSQVGSEDYRVSDPRRRGRDRLVVRNATLTPDGQRLSLQLDDMIPADQLQINADVKSVSGAPVAFTVLQTIRELSE